MFGLNKIYVYIGAGLIVLATIGGLTLSRNYWKSEAIEWKDSAGVVTATIRRVTNNPKLQWKDANEQIQALADSRKLWKEVAGEQTIEINALGAEAERLQKLNATLRAKAEKEIAKREKAINRLEDSAKDPGVREDCQAQIAAAEAALDIIYAEGL